MHPALVIAGISLFTPKKPAVAGAPSLWDQAKSAAKEYVDAWLLLVPLQEKESQLRREQEKLSPQQKSRWASIDRELAVNQKSQAALEDTMGGTWADLQFLEGEIRFDTPHLQHDGLPKDFEFVEEELENRIMKIRRQTTFAKNDQKKLDTLRLLRSRLLEDVEDGEWDDDTH